MSKAKFTGIDLDSEVTAIASMVLDPWGVIPAITPIVDRHDFSDPVLGEMLEALAALHQVGRPVSDVKILMSDLRQWGIDVESASVKEVLKRTVELPHTGSAVFHAERVRDLARLRRIFKTTTKLLELTSDNDAKPDELIAWLEGQLATLRQGSSSQARRIANVWQDVIDDLAERVGRTDKAALMSGLSSADELGLVFVGGELTVLAARPGVGKTAFATQIAMHHANRGRAVLIVSLEMRDKELGSRILISHAGYNHQTIRTGEIDEQCIADLRRARDEIGDVPLFVWSPGRVKAGAIHAAAAVLKASHDLKLLIVDYIGLVLPDDQARKRHEQVGEIVKALRGIAQQFDIPVIALCQLNRAADTQRPTLGNLKESGDIEQDADIVAALYREKDDSREVELLMLKNRQGTLGMVPLRWLREETRFEDASVEDHPNYRPELSYGQQY